MHIDFLKIQQEYQSLEYSPFKLSCIKKAIQLAEQERDYYWQLNFMKDYIYEVIYEGDLFLGIVIFPQYLSLYDAHPEIHEKYPIQTILWVYKWILSNLPGFYQISYEKAMEYLEDFKKRCIENGFSLRHYYDCFASFLENIDENCYKEAIKEYYAQKRDSLSSSKMCELNNEIYFELYHGSVEKALKLAQPILKDKSDDGYVTYNNLLDYYMNCKRDMEKAADYEKLLVKKLKHDNSFMCVTTLLQYYALADIDRGIKLWKKYVYLDIKSRFPLDKFYFARESCFLLKKLGEKRKKKTLKIVLPKEFPLYREDNIYTIDELIEYYKENATKIAEKFDSRNRNHNYEKKLEIINF